jgi:HEXXH motif-containing protein
MTSNDVAGALLRKLSHLELGNAAPAASTQYTFDLDFESRRVWPDLPFDTASPVAHYAEASRPEIQQILGAAASVVGSRAPKALAFVNEQLDSVLIRRSSAVRGASSSSNRELVGFCLLTNLHIPPDRVFVCVEALVHEATHQYLYRTELASGNFCDLDESRTYRSPWSGNRIPLHSLIHAAFVWFGLLTLWCQLAQSVVDREETLVVRDRVSQILFGFAFIPQMMRSPVFPRDSVQPRIAELIDHMAQVTTGIGRPAQEHRTLGDALQSCEAGAWVPQLTASLERVESGWHS